MDLELLTIQPRGYYRHFWSQKIRPDGRHLWKIRHLSLNLGFSSTAEGSALVRLGKTVVVCGIKAALTVPKAEAPLQGFIVPNVDLPPLCSPTFKPGPPSEKAQAASQFVADVIQNSGCILAEDLCIEPGKLAWCLYIDMMCFNYDGNILDASVAAMVAALHSTKLPVVKFNTESEEIKVQDEKKLLHLHAYPVATTYAQLDSEVIVVDPNQEEEFLSEGTFTVIARNDGSMCGIHKLGGECINQDTMEQCMSVAKNHCQLVFRLIETASRGSGGSPDIG